MEGGEKVRRATVLILGVLILMSSVASAAKMPKGSFLNSPVSNVQELAQQVVDDAIVAARYAKHFQTPRNAVVDYFKGNLRVGKLTKDYECTVYNITDKTDTVATKKILSAGTYVFVTLDGKPLLEGKTGNPLASTLPFLSTQEGSRQIVQETGSTSGGASGTSGVTGTTPASSEDVVTRVLGTTPIESGAAMPVIESTVEIVSAMPISAPASIGSSMGSILPVAAAIGAAALAMGGGDGDGGSPPPTDPNPIPEPASMIALALGISALAFRMRKQK